MQNKSRVAGCFVFRKFKCKKDWGYAPEYCEGMWKMLQQENPQDFVLATGVTTSVRKFVELSI